MAEREELRFLRGHSPRLSAYVSALVLQGLRKGETDTGNLAQAALQRAYREGIPSPRLEAGKALETHKRTGWLVSEQADEGFVYFGCPTPKGEYIHTPARIGESQWGVLGFGDTIPTVSGGPIVDAYDVGERERSKCLIIHFAAGILWAPGSKHQTNPQAPRLDSAQRLSRDIRYRQYQQALRCLPQVGSAKDNEPLILAELLPHAHDLMRAHHDRDHRSIICFPPEELAGLNLAIIRVMPSGRYTVHHIESNLNTDRWAYLVSYRGHMRLVLPVSSADANFVKGSPNTVSRQVGCGISHSIGTHRGDY